MSWENQFNQSGKGKIGSNSVKWDEGTKLRLIIASPILIVTFGIMLKIVGGLFLMYAYFIMLFLVAIAVFYIKYIKPKQGGKNETKPRGRATEKRGFL